jgi:chemotaxis response regulator CheB
VEILGGLPPNFPVPILVIQSIHPDYFQKLVARLNDTCLLQIIAAQDGQVPEPGRVYVASDDPCLLVVQHRLRLDRKLQLCRNSLSRRGIPIRNPARCLDCRRVYALQAARP